MFRFFIRFGSRLFGSVPADERQLLGTRPAWCLKNCIGWLAYLLIVFSSIAFAAPPQFSPVLPDSPLTFPRDFGAHPDFRIEWWYATGWLETPDKKPLGFQITFFRSATEHDADNPSRFAPRQLIIAHAAIFDHAVGRLLHDQRSARQGFDLAYAREGNTDVKLDDWRLVRGDDGQYRAIIKARDFTLELSLTPSQAPLPQGDGGFSRKGPKPEQASYYYSEPHLQVTGTVVRNGKRVKVSGTAWLDHEWSTSVLDPDAAGWDWIGINLDDGSALMAFRIRGKSGDKLWAHAALRDKSGRLKQFAPDQVEFIPQRNWRSPRTNATYPVAMRIRTGDMTWELNPLQDDQELDSRQSTGAVYWEGAVTVTRDGRPAGRGYLEMTGYVKPLKL
ncbi:carotenoid 1,2-hydratase [Noviherbaspirillum cavernae]|uniref:Carotenoid 1,2-hydratase n=1 Tax=Noviherbaspirillum cavernae TaxID=2320862 RepID=A0A418X265_9BURK|nr:carotenoid 1,2-hydratase [Noviherbaspirillum cavernae]RJG06542.1 carotenoid 1,2-hydratase [Noviherbaspirillum cavernae]